MTAATPMQSGGLARWFGWLRFDPGTRPGTGPAGEEGGSGSVPPWQRVLGGVLVAVGTVQLALIEVFLVPVRIGSAPIPVAIVLAVVGNVALTRLMYHATYNRGVSALPAALWLVVVLLFASRRPEGDLVIPGTGMGLSFLLIGTIVAAFAVGQVIAPRPPTGRSGQAGRAGAARRRP